MTTTALDTILSFTSSVSPNPEKVDVLKALADVQEQLDTVLRTVPDDKEELCEDQELWLKRWDEVLTATMCCLKKASEARIEPLLKVGTSERIQKANAIAERWKATANRRRMAKDERERGEEEQQAHEAADMNFETEETGNAEEDDEDGSNEAGSRASSEPPKFMAKMLPNARISITRQERTVPPPTSKCVRVEYTAPAKMTDTIKLAEGEIIHDTQCNKCSAQSEECVGVPGRACKKCMRLKIPCNKSGGRGGKAKGVAEKSAPAKKADVAGSSRPKRSRSQRKPFANPNKYVDTTSNECEDEEDEEPGPVRKKVRVIHPEPGAEDMRVAGVLALKELKGEIMTVQGEIKAKEAELGRMGMKVGKLIAKFGDIEAALGM